MSHAHIHRVSKQQLKDEALKRAIEAVWKTHKAYGSVRLALQLQVNHKRIARVMHKYGLKPPRRRSKYFCTRSTSHHTYTNLITQLIPTRPHHIWATDVSFFWSGSRFWYLATIEDLYTRKIVAAQVSKHHDRWLVLAVSQQALRTAGTTPDYIHSDQGTEFMARACTTFWEEHHVAVSVSDKASPWQNGHKESFFSHFKAEFGRTDRFETVGELIEEIYAQIKYYNQDRIHTVIKMPPDQFAHLFSDNTRHVLGT